MATMSDPSPFILVDGSAYLFRAYHALPELTNSAGLQTGAIHGVTSMLRKLVETYRPELMAVVFDAKGPTFRHRLYPEYKANRPPMPAQLAEQIQPTHELIRLMGLPLIVAPDVEADDVIGTLARQAVADGLSVLISTNDKDMAQLVGERVTLINTMDGKLTDRAAVLAKFGVWPEQMIDYLALVGDAVDNIPGVPQCGPKTAARWLATYGNLQGVMDNAEAIRGKIGDQLRASLTFLPLSRDLATIRLNCELDSTPRDLIVGAPDELALRAKLTALEFRTWLRQLDSADHTPERSAEASPVGDAALTGERYDTVLTRSALAAWVEKLQSATLFALDTETTSLDALQARLVGLSFAVAPGEAAYVPVAHDYLDAPVQLSVDEVLDALRPLLEDADRPKVMQNLKYDTQVLAGYGITLRGVRYDTMLESYVFNSTGSRHDMDSLARYYLGHETIHYQDIAGKGAKQLPFNQIALEQAAPYAAEDADITLRLHGRIWPQLNAQAGLRTLFDTIEMPLAGVLARMERTGVRIDAEMLARQTAALAERMVQTERQAHAVAGDPFNLSSPKQIQQIFFERLGLPVIKKTPKGQPSTSEYVLERLAHDGHQLPKLILEYRGLAKLKSTYTEKLPQQINPETGRVHTSFHQAVAGTGRLSSADPNLQNIPVRSEAGRRIRQAFIPADGCKLMAADYSQIELRIMAHLSADRSLLAAFADGVDIHRATAAEVFGVSPQDVTGDQRRSAKAINFGLIYGMSAFGLARQLGIDRGEAQRYVDQYFARYPGVKDYMERTRRQAHQLGYVETLFGRRLHLREINAKNRALQQGAERAAINAPMQGTAADIIKRAMITVDAWLTAEAPEIKMTMQVHDELVFEIPQGQVTAACDRITRLMSAAAPEGFKVPLLVDVGVGDNWDEAH